ncbi:MAG: CsbD family protein [Gammaproteobacteria bacterium]
MNWDIAKGNWIEFKGRVREQWGRLTDDDLDVVAGHRQQLAGRIQQVYGLTREEAERQLEVFEKIHRFD